MFLAGLARTWTYGAVMLLHAISTFSFWQLYLAPYEGVNLLLLTLGHGRR